MKLGCTGFYGRRPRDLLTLRRYFSGIKHASSDVSMWHIALRQLVDKLNGWLNQGVLMLPNLGAALIIIAVFWILARIASNVTARVLKRATPYQEINTLLTRSVWAAIFAAGV